MTFFKPDKTKEIFFTSDTHYGHKNLCRGVSSWEDKDGCRNFDTLEDMNDAIVDGINKKVGKDDILYHLGDWSFGGRQNIPKFRSLINCENIVLILGNHDHHIRKGVNDYDKMFTHVCDYSELHVSKRQKVCMSHYPISSWNDMHRGTIMLHGHCHSTLDNSNAGRRVDVGVDNPVGYMSPWHVDEILYYMNSIVSSKVDHHV